jgi:hypothetical protein
MIIQYGVSKVKFSLRLSSWTLLNEDVWGIGGIAVYILNPPDGGEWSASGSERLSCVEENGTYCGLGEPHRRYERCGEKRNILPPRLEPTFLGGQACSLSFYRLIYPGSLLAIMLQYHLKCWHLNIQNQTWLLRRFCVDLDTGKHAVVEYWTFHKCRAMRAIVMHLNYFGHTAWGSCVPVTFVSFCGELWFRYVKVTSRNIPLRESSQSEWNVKSL